jgi:hypothetical protein
MKLSDCVLYFIACVLDLLAGKSFRGEVNQAVLG